ncbi:DUF5670 family protein [Sphingobacterium zeae]|uniref:DUF5670 family protein n=1 Tax=Sphingobacterium TaxID=28453 RepID=UPI00352116A3
MEDLLYSIAVSIIIIWAVTFLGGFVTEDTVHVLLILAVVTFIFRAITVNGSREASRSEE